MNSKNISEVFAALALPVRVEIFKILVANHKEGICPCDIASQLDMPRNTLSFHLSVMQKVNLCHSQRQGKCLFYRPNCELIHDLSDFLLHDCTICSCSREIKGNINV